MSNVSLSGLHTEEMTDAEPVLSFIFDTPNIDDILIDIVTDKGTAINVTPVLSDDGIVLGEVSSTLTLPDGGATSRASYTRIAAKKTLILVTKTEAGTTSGFVLKVSGVRHNDN